MTHKLTPGTAAMLVTAPLLWAGNAVVGRLVHDLVPPITLNFIRWVLAFAILLPLAHRVLRVDSPLWAHWRRYALLGLLGIGLAAPALLLDADIGDLGRGDGVARLDGARVHLAREAQHIDVVIDADLLFARDHQVAIGQHGRDDGGDADGGGVGGDDFRC